MNWKEKIRDWWYKYHDEGYELPEQSRVELERIIRDSQQQLLERIALIIEIEESEDHGWSIEHYMDIVEDIKALIQEEKESITNT